MARSVEAKYLPRRANRLRTLRYQLDSSSKPPYIGITQGGSSRKYAGSKPAATHALLKKSGFEEWEVDDDE